MVFPLNTQPQTKEMLKPTCFEPKLSKEHPWVQAQEDTQVYIFSRFETGMPGEVRFHNENVCKLLLYFSLCKKGKTIPAVYCKTLATLKHSIDHSINGPADILPFNQVLELQLRPNQKKAPVCLGQTSPILKEQHPG